MATPVFTCGGECGQVGSVGQHWAVTGTTSFSTTTVRSGARSLRVNPTASFGSWNVRPVPTGRIFVGRVYILFTTLPNGVTNCSLAQDGGSLNGAYFNPLDSKIYAGTSFTNLGSTGISVTTGQWYRIDYKIDQSANPHLVDVQVDGAACGQASEAVAATDLTSASLVINNQVSISADVFFDDFCYSFTSVDYPIGDGYVNHFVPTSDGTHNVAGAADFRKYPSGDDITNATTDAYTHIDDVPLKALSPVELINIVAPPNATDYTEHIFGPAPGISTPTTGPRAVEVIALVAQAATGAGNMEIRLNDNGTMGTVYTATAVAGIVAGKYVRAHFADPPSAASVWNALNDGSNGDFRDLRVRIGSPAAVDANPDQYVASIMIEAEFAPAVAAAQRVYPTNIRQAVRRASLR